MIGQYDAIFNDAAREWRVDPHLLRAIATQESGGNPRAVSRAGATGVMQIMPETGRMLGMTDLNDPAQSIYAGAKYMSQLLDQYKRPELALAAYNAGPKRVDAFLKGGALPDETMKYVPAVTAHYQRLRPTQVAANGSFDDFLKSLPGDAADKPSAAGGFDDFLKSLPGGVAAPPETEQPPVGGVAKYGARGDLGPVGLGEGAAAVAKEVPGAVGRIGSAAAHGFVEGAQKPPPLVTPVMEGLGVYPPAGQDGTVLQRMNKLVIDPLAQVGEWAVRGLGGAFRGAQAGVAQAGAEVGQPQLGRDLAAMPEAFPFPFLAGPRPPNRLAPAPVEPPRLALPPPEPLPRVPAPDFLPPGARPPEPAPARPSVPPEFLPPNTPRSAGAAATPTQAAEMSRREMVAQRATAERDKLMEPQPGGADMNEYIPGVQTTEAQYVQQANAARNEKRLEMEMPEPFKEVRRANNDKRVEYYADLEGTPTLRERAKEARDQQAEADLRATWKNKQPADVAPVQETAAAILESPDGRRPAVRTAVDEAVRELVDAKGNVITDPEMLYGVRKHISDLIEARDGSGAKKNIAAERQLLALRDALDGVIEQAAPGYRQYLKNYADASKPIDEMAVLQEWAPKIRDTQGRITYSGVQRMMKDIVTAREGKTTHPAQGISDETMLKLWALRDDLRRVASAEDLAKARGSDTAQNVLDIVRGTIGRAAGEGAAAALGAPPGVASMLFGTLTAPMRANKLKNEVGRALSPDKNRLSQPPNP